MKTGVALSGCGVKDGSEIHEAVLALLFLDQAGAEVLCMAPDSDQMHVMNHLTDEPVQGESRNVLLESARIARGNIRSMNSVNAGDIDSLVFPGGFGAAKNLCTFATDSTDCRVHPQVERLINEMVDAKKPVGALCIAPVLIARVLGKRGLKVKVTVGNDPGVAKAINAMGAVHVNCPVNEAVVDETYRVVTSPAYMLANNIKEVADSADALVKGLMKLAKS